MQVDSSGAEVLVHRATEGGCTVRHAPSQVPQLLHLFLAVPGAPPAAAVAAAAAAAALAAACACIQYTALLNRSCTKAAYMLPLP